MAIYYHDEYQKEAAKKKMEEITQIGLWNDPIVTELTPAEKFYVAENYHQNYFANNPNQPYCRAVVSPKVAKFRSKFSHLMK